MTVSSSNGNFDEIKWGIIGLGDVITIKAGPAFYKANGSTLSAVMRRTPGFAQQWIEENKKEHNFPRNVAESIKGYDTVEAMLRDVELDALCGNTPRCTFGSDTSDCKCKLFFTTESNICRETMWAMCLGDTCDL